MSFSFNAPTEAAISFGSLFGPQLEIAPIARGSEDLAILKWGERKHHGSAHLPLSPAGGTMVPA